MSRCFPFPRTVCEKKARTDEVDLLKKEKQRERKHKKDRRDKDKREGKEKREKEGRDGKHKDKKDKKEKHKEKKKDKSRDKDKSKIVTTDDKAFPGHPDSTNAEKLDHKDYQQNDKKGILFDNGLGGNNGQKAGDNNHLVEENKDSKFLLEFDRRIRDVDRGVGNQLLQKFANLDHTKNEGTLKLVAKWSDSNEKLMDKGLDAKKIDTLVQNNAGNFHHSRVDRIPRLLGKHSERNLELTLEEKEKGKDKKDEEKEKIKEKKDEAERKVKEKKDEEGKVKEKKDEGKKDEGKKDEGKKKVKEKKDDNRRHKRKDKEKEKKEKEKKGHGKDKDRDKEKRKEEKAKELSELETTEQNKLNESNKIGPVDSISFTPFPKNNHGVAVSVSENTKKRKDIESNGAPCANDNWQNKFPRLSSSVPMTENGRTLEACQISITNASNRSRLANNVNVKAESKECKINGITQPLTVPSNKTHTDTMSADDLIIKASAKQPRPPHPDTKYLSQVCSVPTVDQWSEFDDQEWLFDNSLSRERKPEVESSEVGETSLVWAEALHIQPVDVFALPYVIPY